MTGRQAPAPSTESFAVPRVPAPKASGCRTVVDGTRCGHDFPTHKDRGYEGWKVRCPCGCTTYRGPWGELSGDLAICLALITGSIFVSAMMWTGMAWAALEFVAWLAGWPA